MIPIALIALVVLSIILIVGAFFIWKSDSSLNQKIISIILILALFTVATIVNEAKSLPRNEVSVPTPELESYFYNFKNTEFKSKYELPLLNDTKEFVNAALGKYSFENRGSIVFLLLEGEKGIGKTYALKKYAKMLQIDHTPTLYLDIKQVGADIDRLAAYFKVSNISLLNPIFDKFKNGSQTPAIILDHFEYAFSNTEPAATSKFLKYLTELFDSKKVNIVLVTNKPDVKLKLRAGSSEYVSHLTHFIVC